MKYFYHIYQFVVPLVFFPASFWLWFKRLNNDYAITMLVMFVPVVAYYVFVIIGILHFRLWEMNTWLTIKGIRPHHGFVIGTAAALLAYLTICLTPVGGGLGSIFTCAFLVGSIFGFWNWWYETYAIKSNFISIYTKRKAEGASAEEAVTDYAPVLFGSMGACHGAMVKTAEVLLVPEHSDQLFWLVAVVGGLGMIFIPTASYLFVHRIRYGESGLRSYIIEIKSKKSETLTTDENISRP